MEQREEQRIRSLIQESLARLDQTGASGPPDVAALPADTPIEDLGMDSVASLELVGLLEERLDAEFPDAELSRLGTLGDLIELVRRSAA